MGEGAPPVAGANHERTCEPAGLAALPGVRITAAQRVAKPVPHCAVQGVIGTETGFELLLPDRWNRKFLMGGGGGFVGEIINTALVFNPLADGYATVGTDTGHRGHPLDASWALNNLERIVSFGHQAVHRTAVTAKALASGYYGESIARSLFVGCSRGGGQGLMEAQRYPEDFDGIVAMAPAYHWTGELAARKVKLAQAMYPDPDNLAVATITPEKQRLIGEAVLAACDDIDGLADGILNNPMLCNFNPASLACGVAESQPCLDERELAAAQAVYSDVVVNGIRVYPGLPPGAELTPGGWSRWITGGIGAADIERFQGSVAAASRYAAPVVPNGSFGFGTGVMKYLVTHNPEWDYSTYDFVEFFTDVAPVAPTLDAASPDLDAFRERGGKLLLTNSWQDMAISPYGTIEYADSVIRRDPAAAQDVKLFLFPGVEHCQGGPGPSWVNYVQIMETWLDTGEAPGQLSATWLDDNRQPDGSRPVCAYPAFPVYNGAGDPRDASSFSCVETIE